MQSWVGSGRASVMVQSSRLHLDPTCGTSLDTLKSPDCDISPPTRRTNPTNNPTVANPSVAARQSGGGASVGEIGGIAVGGVIIVLLIVLIVLIAVVVLVKMKSKLALKYVRYDQLQLKGYT